MINFLEMSSRLNSVVSAQKSQELELNLFQECSTAQKSTEPNVVLKLRPLHFLGFPSSQSVSQVLGKQLLHVIE